MNNEPMNEEMTLNLYDILGKFLSKWKQIILCMLVCAVLLTLIGYVRDSAKAKAAAEAAATAASSENFDFTSITQEQGEDLIRMATRYQRLIDDENAYLENSVLMNLPGNVATVYRMQYVISGTLTNSQKQSLQKMYSLAMKNDSVYQKISDALAPKYDVKPNYVGELISDSSDTTDKQLAILQDGVGSVATEAATGNTAVGDSTMVYEVTITGYDTDFCKTIADIVDSVIQKQTLEISQIIPHTIKLSNGESSTCVDKDYLTDRKTNFGIVKSATDDITTLTKSLTDAEKEHVSAVLSNEGDKDVQQGTSAAETVVSPVTLSPKNAMIGAVLGLVLVAGWFMLSYMLSPMVHTIGELEEGFGQTVLGTIRVSKADKRLTSALDKISIAQNNQLPKDVTLQLIGQMISGMAETKKISSVGVSCLATGDEAQAICAELAAAFSDNGLKAIAMGSVLSGVDAMHACADVDALVLVEGLENTVSVELKETMKYFRAKNQPVLGAVVLS